MLKPKTNGKIRNQSRNSWAAVAVVSVEPFFVPLEVLAASFGFTGHARVFARGIV
jgi:hypothetical protein